MGLGNSSLNNQAVKRVLLLNHYNCSDILVLLALCISRYCTVLYFKEILSQVTSFVLLFLLTCFSL